MKEGPGGGFSLEYSLGCKPTYWPGRQMACRDEQFVWSGGAACEPAPAQTACGARGFSCCEVFHGWAEKVTESARAPSCC